MDKTTRGPNSSDLLFLVHVSHAILGHFILHSSEIRPIDCSAINSKWKRFFFAFSFSQPYTTYQVQKFAPPGTTRRHKHLTETQLSSGAVSCKICKHLGHLMRCLYACFKIFIRKIWLYNRWSQES